MATMRTVIQQYRIFQAMLALGEFTVADLEQATRANPRSVRTTLQRNPELVERISREETGRRGGAWIRYRLKPEADAELRRRLGELEPRVSPPNDLLAAEELLLEQAGSDPAARARTRRRARRLHEGGLREMEASGSRSADAPVHALAVSVLLGLSEAQDDLLDSAATHALERDIRALRRELATIEDRQISAAIARRLDDSPLAVHVESDETVATRLADALGQALQSVGWERAPSPQVGGTMHQIGRMLDRARAAGMELVFGLSPVGRTSSVMDRVADDASVGHASFEDWNVIVAAAHPGEVLSEKVGEFAYEGVRRYAKVPVEPALLPSMTFNETPHALARVQMLQFGRFEFQNMSSAPAKLPTNTDALYGQLKRAGLV
jgi:hypothetical protein